MFGRVLNPTPQFIPYRQMQPVQPMQHAPRQGWTAQPNVPANPSRPAPVPFPSQAAATAPAPIFRAQGNNTDPVPKMVVANLPPPEALGIRPVSAPPAVPVATVDWNHIHERLRRLNPLDVNIVRLPAGNFRITLVLATNQPNRNQVFEVVAIWKARSETSFTTQ
jgi:hypothetical protein